MHLTYRPAFVDDVDACLAIAPPQLQCRPEVRDYLPSFLRRGLQDGSLIFGIVENWESTPADRIASFGCSAFVTPPFVAQLLGTPRWPAIARIVELDMIASSPIMTLDQVRSENTSGELDLLVLLLGVSPAVESVEDLNAVKLKTFELFEHLHQGYRLRQVLQEVYTQREMQRATAIGARELLRFAAGSNGNGPPPETYLSGATRSEVAEGSALWPIFAYQRPRMQFTPGEQDILRMAILDRSDPEIAAVLHLSQSTVHKRWQSLLDRASLSDAVWIPEAFRTGDREKPGRGIEKRRFLVSYLRTHLEELRPYVRTEMKKPPH